ncbi:MAG: PilW family protein [Planctomycetota bacterium]
MKQRGFTVLELLVSTVIFVILMGSVALAISGDVQTHRVLVAHMGPELRARNAVERIASDLRMSSEWAEDRNQNGQFEAAEEDTNRNGVFDSNWSLGHVEPWLVNQPSLTFNRRIDETGAGGELLASGIYSRPVTYRVDGTDLVREWQRTGPDDEVQTLRSVIASGVLAIRFSREGPLVSVDVDVALPAAISRTGRRTLTTRIWLRN